MAKFAKPGSAILTAMLLSALLALAGVTLVTHMKSNLSALRESYKYQRAEMSADAQIANAIVALDAGESSVSNVPEGGISIQDVNGLVDLNRADAELLSALFEAIGVPQERSARLADAIADWRDPDSMKRPHGAERDDYPRGRAPRDGPFKFEEELALVLGMDQDIVACVNPYLTVFAGGNQPDAASAPAVVKNALISAGSAQQASSVSAIPIGRVLRVTGSSSLSKGAALEITRWVRLTGDPKGPVLTHRSRQRLISTVQSEHACQRIKAEARKT